MKRVFSLILSIAFTVGFSWWAFRSTDWAGMWASLQTANYFWLLPYFAILTGIHFARTWRWGFWLSGIEKVPFKKLNEASAIGFMMLLILPFRLGEFARPYYIARNTGIRKTAAMTSVVLERIADGLVVATLLRVLIFFMPANTAGLKALHLGSTVMFAVFGGGLAFLLFALWQQKRAVALVAATAGRISPKLAEKMGGIVDSFVGAMRQLPSGGAVVGFIVCTAVYWGLNGYGMAMLARAFDCNGMGPTCQPLTLTPFQGYVTMCVLVAGVMIPAAPGSMGTFHAFVKMGLSLFVPAAVLNSHGLAYTNILWLAQMVQQVLFGLIALATSHTSFTKVASDLSHEAEAAEQGTLERGGLDVPAEA